MKNIYTLMMVLVTAIAVSLTFAVQKGEAQMSEKLKSQDTSHLTDKQKYVTMENGTEAPFRNEYWDHKEPGIYVDVINGRPLFSSTDKYDSGSGWPAFTRPIEESLLAETTDASHGMVRTEIRSSSSDAHLGHVFNDGPAETGGLRYCINSASLRFVHKDDLEKEGYGNYLVLFDEE